MVWRRRRWLPYLHLIRQGWMTQTLHSCGWNPRRRRPHRCHPRRRYSRHRHPRRFPVCGGVLLVDGAHCRYWVLLLLQPLLLQRTLPHERRMKAAATWAERLLPVELLQWLRRVQVQWLG